MDTAEVKERFWFLRYWPLALIGLLLTHSIYADGYLLAAAAVGAMSVLWIGLSAIEAVY